MFLTLINNSLKRYFDSDPEVAAQLGELEDQRILLRLAGLNRDFLITSKNSSIVVTEYQYDEDATEPTATIHASVGTLLHLVRGEDYKSMFDSGTLTIDGDVESVNHLYLVFKQIDIDWEEIASRYVGDSLAYQSGVFVRRIRSYQQRSVKNFCLDVSEYLREESRIVPARTEINRFLHDVDALDADIERLEARTHRLARACNQ